MGKVKGALKGAARYAVKTYRYYSGKRFTTVAGTLVYFFLMSLAPFLFWLTMFFGEVDIAKFARYPVFDAVMPILTDLQQSAGGATGGAGVILIITTLYSSTNFFYHLRRSGEIIYGGTFKKGGIRLRLASLGLIGGTLALTACAVGAAVAAEMFIGSAADRPFVRAAAMLAALVAAAFVAAFLNMFVCPYKTTLSAVLPGSLFTVLLWVACAAGFAVYLRFADPVRLYGKIASVIVFLLWCYLMMNCFVIGVIYNVRHNVTPPRLRQ